MLLSEERKKLEAQALLNAITRKVCGVKYDDITNDQRVLLRQALEAMNSWHEAERNNADAPKPV